MLPFFYAFQRLTLSALLVMQWSTVYAFGPTAGTAAPPATPGENIPAGLEDVPPQLQAVIQKIAGLPAQMAAQGAQMTIPNIAPLQAGLKIYMANRATCIADQARASGFCREETNPQLQTQLMAINAIVAGVNTIAVNDACSTASKVMGMAQMALTGYTAACGLMRKKCEMSCNLTGTGIKQMINAFNTAKATCAGIPVACAEGHALLETYRGEGTGLTVREASISNPRAIHYKANLCTHSYGMLLASAGVSIFSVAKSFKDGQKCDDDTKSKGGSASSGAASPSTSAPISSGGGAVAGEGTSSMSTGTGTTETAPIGSPAMPRTTASDGDNTANNVVITPNAEVADRSRFGSDTSKSGLREYLPGGTKAAVAVKGQSTRPVDVTSAAGKTNFEKMRTRFQELGLEE